MCRFFTLIAVLVIVLSQQESAFSQLPNDIVNAATAGSSAAATGSTTEGIRGETTEGIATNSSETGGQAGSNLLQEFVGGPSSDEFVGSRREATTNSNVNRLFRAITGVDVPTGGTQDSSGEPRQVPVSLKLGFRKPAPLQLTALAGDTPISFEPYLQSRPELEQVEALMNEAGVVTLQGSVPDASTRRLAANLIRFQPGVSRVQNQLQIVGTSPAAP